MAKDNKLVDKKTKKEKGKPEVLVTPSFAGAQIAADTSLFPRSAIPAPLDKVETPESLEAKALDPPVRQIVATPSPENAITSASLVPTMIDSDMNTEDLDMETKYRQALQRADNAEKLVQNAHRADGRINGAI